MTIHAFELRDVAEVDGVSERSRGFVAEDALRRGQIAEGDRVAENFILPGGERGALIEMKRKLSVRKTKKERRRRGSFKSSTG
ncbi:MAG: hypothetical protein QOD32_2690 [Pyrinomonadaceae bacterium]|nr:hypothetical protein [Pyrinomonadaceae bacterium]